MSTAVLLLLAFEMTSAFLQLACEKTSAILLQACEMPSALQLLACEMASALLLPLAFEIAPALLQLACEMATAILMLSGLRQLFFSLFLFSWTDYVSNCCWTGCVSNCCWKGGRSISSRLSLAAKSGTNSRAAGLITKPPFWTDLKGAVAEASGVSTLQYKQS